MTRKWQWKRGSAGFKDGKLYLGSNKDKLSKKDYHKPTNEVIIIRASDFYRWKLIRLEDGSVRQVGSKAGIPINRILKFAKLAKNKDKNPYVQFVEAVGEKRLKDFLKIHIPSRMTEAIKYSLKIEGFYELYKRIPILGVEITEVPIRICRKWFSLKDSEILEKLLDYLIRVDYSHMLTRKNKGQEPRV